MKKFISCALLVVSFGMVACAPSPRTDANPAGGAGSEGRPEITLEKIRDNINGRRVEGVPEETNASPPINWTFVFNEPKEFTVLEKQVKDETATVIVDMKTRTAEGSEHPRHLSGKLRLHYELQTDFVLRRWRIVEVENISMKYKDEFKREEKKEEQQKKSQEEQDDDEQDAGENDARR